MKVEITGDLLKKFSQQTLQKQLRFATAQSLTQVAFDARRNVQKMLHHELNITRSFLPNSVVVVKATKDNLESVVGFLSRADFTKLLEHGGIRKPQGRTIAIPVSAANSKNRVPKSKRPRELLAKGAFSATINGVAGIWMVDTKRGKKQIKLMYAYEDRPSYDPQQIRFYKTVETTAVNSFKNRMPQNFYNALRQAR